MGLLKSRTTPPRPIGVVMMIALIASVSLSSTSLAQEVTLKSTVANWSIYCLKNVSEIKPQDCSLVTAAVGESDPNVWVRVGLTQSSPQEMEMTIRTPRLEHLKKGISIRTEDGQLGRAFIDTWLIVPDDSRRGTADASRTFGRCDSYVRVSDK